jgi:hypothetical protein
VKNEGEALMGGWQNGRIDGTHVASSVIYFKSNGATHECLSMGIMQEL